jgi:hypothetical protein
MSLEDPRGPIIILRAALPVNPILYWAQKNGTSASAVKGNGPAHISRKFAPGALYRSGGAILLRDYLAPSGLEHVP